MFQTYKIVVISEKVILEFFLMKLQNLFYGYVYKLCSAYNCAFIMPDLSF